MGFAENAIADARGLPVHQLADAARLADLSRKLLAFCFCYILGAALLWPTTYFAMILMYFSQLVAQAPISLLFAIAPAALVVSPRAPAGVTSLIRANGPRAALVVAIFILSLAAYTTYKVNIPKIVPFYCDKALADFGQFIHGMAPWRIAHAFDSDALAWLVELTYSKIWFVEWFGMVFFAAMYARRPLHLRYLTALALTTAVVGTLLATLLSSAGPIFYDQILNDTRYADLLATLRQRAYNEHVLYYSNYLMESYKTGTPVLGAGISAMPSMHVAIATLNALYLARLNRWAGVAGWSFAIFIVFGSVYTGWHYVEDGYVAMLVVILIWRRCGNWFEGGARAPTLTADALLPSPVSTVAMP